MTASYLVEKRIENFNDGHLFVIDDFLDIANNDCVRQYLSRLTKAGKITRITSGIYMKPRYSSFLRCYVPPLVDDVIRIIANKNCWKLIPPGVTALNLLGLSTQVPAHYDYLSNGPCKTYKIGNHEVSLKHVANKMIDNMSFKTSLVANALTALGKQNVTEDDISLLKSTLTDDEKINLLTEGIHMTKWIYKVFVMVNQND
ncbi:MAG: type IV toxin-antitoxin system AbiEi family antitoxin domain-containing protein [Acholeplasmatales bacterium]|jgi:hypothetical protein|nr:type IV toxin-antitoxin system AbiEi family antitoxin domain-containing protein [Acholeplasmatales bacterium]